MLPPSDIRAVIGLQPAEPPMPLEQRIAQLVSAHGFTRVDADNGEAFADAPGDAVLLLTAETRTNPESWDAAIILPELLKAQSAPLRAGIADPAASRALAVRYGVHRFPALVLLRGGEPQHYVDAIEGLRDWDVYQQKLTQSRQLSTRPPPSIGLAVVSADPSACH